MSLDKSIQLFKTATALRLRSLQKAIELQLGRGNPRMKCEAATQILSYQTALLALLIVAPTATPGAMHTVHKMHNETRRLFAINHYCTNVYIKAAPRQKIFVMHAQAHPGAKSHRQFHVILYSLGLKNRFVVPSGLGANRRIRVDHSSGQRPPNVRLLA